MGTANSYLPARVFETTDVEPKPDSMQSANKFNILSFQTFRSTSRHALD